MRSIIESCEPREDILRGTFNPEIFTASLSQVMAHYRGRGSAIDNLYTDAEQFFRRGTYPTQGMRMVLTDVLLRLSGDSTAPAIHRLETAFGGGKTHTLIGLAHLAFRGREIADATRDVIGDAPLSAPGEVAVAGVPGDEIAVHKPQGPDLVPYTLWGEIAYQIGGEDLYRRLEADVTSRDAPGRSYFEAVFGGRKALVMLDELAQYAARLEAARPNGAEQLAAFLMALNGYARTHKGLAVVVTLAGRADAFSRQTRRLSELLAEVTGREVDEQEAADLAARAEKDTRSVVARDATTVVPVQAAEISQVLSKRLFVRIDQDAAEQAADAYAEMYTRSAAQLPDEAAQADFRRRMAAHYPFHPTFIAFLNEKLSTVETFQGTRGVLRVLALAIRNIWTKRQAPPMIHACHLDLRDARIVNEITGRTGAGALLTALNTDVGGPDTGTLAAGRSRAEIADRRNPHPAGLSLHELAWKTVFLHSLVGRADGLGSNLFGITESDALFATAFPGMTPPQVQTALQAIQTDAFYLRFEHGRYYASLEPSVNRALAEIRDGLREEQVADLLAATARKIVGDDNGTFRVARDATLPEHIPDNAGRPTLAIVALDAERIDAEAFVTTKGANVPRIQQNLVFLLVPQTVHVAGETWSEDRVGRAREAHNRLKDLARTVMAMRRLKDKPENYGIRTEQLARDEFDKRMRERELALTTNVNQLYDALWFPSASGSIVRKEIKGAVGEGGAAVVQEIRRVLKADGELLTADNAATQEALLALAKRFFDLGQTPTLAKLREAFACNRRWPVLDSPAIFDQIIRAGVERGVWCLFKMGGEDKVRPDHFYGRDDGGLPFGLDLADPEWSIVTVQGANQRGWGPGAEVDPAKVERWVAGALAEGGAAYVSDIARKVAQQHGEVPERTVLAAIDKLVQGDRAMTYAGRADQEDKPQGLVHGSQAILHHVRPTDVIVTPAEAARRGWIAQDDPTLRLDGREGLDRLWPLLGRLGSLYMRGAKSEVGMLDLYDLEIDGSARLRITVEHASPETMKRLGELFEVLAGVAKRGSQTGLLLELPQPEEDCLLVRTLKGEGQA